MMDAPLTYVAVTPARNEVENLPRLAAALAAQERPPARWIIVENGSVDGTPELIERLASEHPWIELLQLTRASAPQRGASGVRAIAAALELISAPPDVLVNLDADISMAADYFSRLLGAFEADKRLGIASGSAYEIEDGVWTQRHSTGSSVWGASHAYRWECLQQVLPLDERLGWDAIDEVKANARGWSTRTLRDLPFRHHRPEGEREGARARRWFAEGDVAYFMNYRLSYLLARTVFRAATDPSAVAMLAGYADARMRRLPRCDDPAAHAYLHSQQRLRNLALRAREATGRTTPS
jgi:glycosyltransferase involved in cell wall biosynthesis